MFDVESITNYYQLNKSFKGLKNCGLNSDKELTKLSLKYISKLDSYSDNLNDLDVIVNDFDREHKDLLNKIIGLHFNTLSVRLGSLPQPRYKVCDLPIVTEANKAYELFLKFWDKGLIQYQEEFKVMLLNNSNRVLGIAEVSKGGMDSVLVDMKVIFSIALKSSARRIILAHNHPSGKLVPSNADKLLTQKAREAGKLLDIDVCDHLIINEEGYCSLANEIT